MNESANFRNIITTYSTNYPANFCNIRIGFASVWIWGWGWSVTHRRSEWKDSSRECSNVPSISEDSVCFRTNSASELRADSHAYFRCAVYNQWFWMWFARTRVPVRWWRLFTTRSEFGSGSAHSVFDSWHATHLRSSTCNLTICNLTLNFWKIHMTSGHMNPKPLKLLLGASVHGSKNYSREAPAPPPQNAKLTVISKNPLVLSIIKWINIFSSYHLQFDAKHFWYFSFVANSCSSS